MDETIFIKWNDLLERFSKIHVENHDTTYLELCQYPYNRFEEICSRILKFFFQPDAEHSFKNLWLRSLFEAINQVCDDYSHVSTHTEVTTSNTNDESDRKKKIDIVIETTQYIIAIENKIGADVYNPLHAYAEYLNNKYPDKQKIKLVLSAHAITSGQELHRINKNGFTIVYYKQLFQIVQKHLGEYIRNCKSKYLVFMMDFMDTVNNKMNFMENNELNEYFFNNTNRIKQLIQQYQNWQNRILQIQKSEIASLKEERSQETGVNWWVFQGWDLGISFLNNTIYRIGIESSYRNTKDDPVCEFHIYITTWKKECWFPYKESVLEKYPPNQHGFYLDENAENGERVYYHMPIILGNNHEQIIERLAEYYSFVKELTKQFETGTTG